MGELAMRARLRKQTMTTLVRLAERDGLVRRVPDPQDGRVIRVWLISGREAIQAALTAFAALRPTMTSDIRKVVAAGDVATVLNAWRLQGTGQDGSPITMAATSADVMRRRPDGSWAILIDDPWGA